MLELKFSALFWLHPASENDAQVDLNTLEGATTVQSIAKELFKYLNADIFVSGVKGSHSHRVASTQFQNWHSIHQ